MYQPPEHPVTTNGLFASTTPFERVPSQHLGTWSLGTLLLPVEERIASAVLLHPPLQVNPRAHLSAQYRPRNKPVPTGLVKTTTPRMLVYINCMYRVSPCEMSVGLKSNFHPGIFSKRHIGDEVTGCACHSSCQSFAFAVSEATTKLLDLQQSCLVWRVRFSMRRIDLRCGSQSTHADNYAYWL